MGGYAFVLFAMHYNLKLVIEGEHDDIAGITVT